MYAYMYTYIVHMMENALGKNDCRLAIHPTHNCIHISFLYFKKLTFCLPLPKGRQPVFLDNYRSTSKTTKDRKLKLKIKACDWSAIQPAWPITAMDPTKGKATAKVSKNISLALTTFVSCFVTSSDYPSVPNSLILLSNMNYIESY